MAFARTGDIVTHYRLEGPDEAPVLMFANSIGTGLQIWDEVAATLSTRYRVLRYDMRGHGLSDAPSSAYTMAALADDCAALLDALGIDRAHFCGLSIGGMVGQQFATAHSRRLRRLVLCDTGMRIGTPAMWQERIDNIGAVGLAGMADGVLQRWFTEAFMRDRPDQLAGYRNMLTRTPAEGYAGACAAIRDADFSDSAASITAPTLVVCGARDIATPPEMTADLAAAIPGARHVNVDGAAHLPCVEQPEALSRHIAAFLEESDDD